MNSISKLYYRLKDWTLYHLHPNTPGFYQDVDRSKVSHDGDPVAIWRPAKNQPGIHLTFTVVHDAKRPRPILRVNQ